MAQTTVLSARTAAGNADFTVGSTPVTIIMYATDGVISQGIQCQLLRKVTATTKYQPAMGKNGPVFLTRECLELTVYAPGDYRVPKAVTAEEIGFAKDEA